MRSSSLFVCLLTTMLAVSPAAAGPWGALPEAIARLQVNPTDGAAESVIQQAEASIIVQAESGRLPAVVVLVEAYASLVMRLPDGEERVKRVERRTAAALVTYGRGRRASDLESAARAWTLAAGYDRSGPAIKLLREILLPPADPDEGQQWTAPVDGAQLVYQTPTRIRIGCSEADRRCRDNEILFRWVEMPGFWIESREVTNDLYRRCVDAGACAPPLDARRFDEKNRGREPVVGLTWTQARSYARWAGRRLPSEAEWERAARGQDLRVRFPWGNGRRAELAHVWTEIVSGSWEPQPVGSYPATGWGLFDMAGNVWEWCEDRYQPGFTDLAADGSATRSGRGRVVRGGSWRRGIDLARVSARSWFDEDYMADDVGFRCATDRSEDVSDSRVLAIAERAHSISVDPGTELTEVSLSAEDRRYLERRAVTWLLLEDRAAEAVAWAGVLIQMDPGDSVALDLLRWVEEEITTEARSGSLERVDQLYRSYVKSIGSLPRFNRRIQATGVSLRDALNACGEANARVGDRDRAVACFQEGLLVAPGDSRFRRGLASLERTAGELTTWKSDGKVMAWVPDGNFRFGASEGDRQADPDEYPVNVVSVRGFWLDSNEVTNAEYRRCVDVGACTPPSKTETYDDPHRSSHPVLWVTWHQANDYAEWAGKRLPTEVEWEWAARAGGVDRYPWGNEWDPAYANGIGTGGPDYWPAEAPVRSYPANGWGLHDLIGNAAEWVQDVYHVSYGGMPQDGRAWVQETGPSTERQRVLRGGSFAEPVTRLRVSRRVSRKATDSHRTTGFRCAAD